MSTTNNCDNSSKTQQETDSEERSRIRCLHNCSGRLTREANLWCVCDLCGGRIHVDELLYHLATLQEIVATAGIMLTKNAVAGTPAARLTE